LGLRSILARARFLDWYRGSSRGRSGFDNCFGLLLLLALGAGQERELIWFGTGRGFSDLLREWQLAEIQPARTDDFLPPFITPFLVWDIWPWEPVDLGCYHPYWYYCFPFQNYLPLESAVINYRTQQFRVASQPTSTILSFIVGGHLPAAPIAIVHGIYLGRYQPWTSFLVDAFRNRGRELKFRGRQGRNVAGGSSGIFRGEVGE
jgi:hypothetical protein